MTDREAMQQALDALGFIYSPLHVREINKVGAAMNALRERLAQPEQEPVAWEVGVVNGVVTRRLAQPTDLQRTNEELLETLEEIAYGLESARIWGGMDWSYNPLHPYKYLPLRDKARAAIAKEKGEQT